MLQGILSNVKMNLENKLNLNNNRIELLIDFMKTWKKNDIIYPSQVKSLLLLDYDEVYKILNIIKDLGILEYNYEVYCSKCEKFVDTYLLDSLNQFPENLYCDLGKHKLNPLDDVILIFKVIYDGK